MKTFVEVLQEIRTRLLENIPVFDEGYAYARPDSSKGLVVTAGNEGHCVSISDLEGDYFYIRVPNAINSNVAKAKTDCNAAIKQTYSCTLVAVVREADEFLLSDALVNELLRTRVAEVKATWIDAIAIIDSELRGLDKKAVAACKARIGDRCLVRVDFELSRIFESHNCTYQICKPC